MVAISHAAATTRAYARLGNVYFFDYHLAFLVVLSLLPATSWHDPEVWISVSLLAIGYFFLHSATVAFDDVTGFKDGTDAKNYLDEPSYLRKAQSKPLIMGELTLSQAQRFSWISAVLGVAIGAAGFLIAPYHPVWLWAVALIGALLCLQYSYGLNLSHIGGQELVLFFGVALPVAVPYILFTGEITGLVWMQTVLFGFWAMMVSVYSNIHDLEVDRRNGRINLATKNSSTGYATVLRIFASVDLVITLVFVLTGLAPALFLLVLVPVFVLRVVQVEVGVRRENPLLGRQFGRRIHELGAVLLILGNFWALH